jgi:hypothetical protein
VRSMWARTSQILCQVYRKVQPFPIMPNMMDMQRCLPRQ